MSVLRGPDGKFYDIPDDRLASYAVPPEKVREMFATGRRTGARGPDGTKWRRTSGHGHAWEPRGNPDQSGSDGRSAVVWRARPGGKTRR